MFRWSKKKKAAAGAEEGAVNSQVTQRFTINLPTGQKTVLRASPLSAVGDLVISACKEKGLELDLDKYVLQLPKKPGIPIDPRATILQTGVQEISLVSLENADRNYAMSMPDLSKLPPSANDPRSFVQLNGQPKKKRGFLSFLGKKDKTFKAEVRRSLVLKSTSTMDVSTPPTTRVTTLPQTVLPELDQNHQLSRPKSMFVSSDTLPLNDKPYEQHPQPIIAPPRKKRRAPEPPVLANSHVPEEQRDLSLNESLEINKDTKESVSALQEQTESNGQKDILHTTVVSQPVFSEEIHPDINGRHDLNLPAYESPDADDVTRMKAHIKNIVNSSASTENITSDSTMHLASDDMLMKDTLHDNAVLKIDTRVTEPVQNSSSPGAPDSSPSHKRNQAPVPPSPVLTSSSPRMETSTLLSPPSTEDSARISTLQTPEVDKDCVDLVQTHSDVSSIFAPHKEIESPTPGNQKEIPTSITSGKQERLTDSEDQNDTPDISSQSVLVFSENKNKAAAMDFNDILDGVVFDEEPWPLQLALSKKAGTEAAQKDSMMMMETASVTSENIDQIDDSLHAGRPCAFIPPPPPSEPPPPEPIDFEPLTSTTAPIFVDKGTGVNEDNASLATSSAKSSPGQASYGGLNEMALFIEQMNSVTLDNQVDKEEMLLNDINSKASTSAPLVTSDSATQSSLLQADSWDTSSEMDLLTRKENHILSNIAVAPFIDESEDFRIGNEDTSFESEEIMNNLPTLPPPPQFEDNVDISQEDKYLIGENEEEIAEKEDKQIGKEEEKVEKSHTKSEEVDTISEKEDTQVKTEDKKAEQEDTKVEKEGNKTEEDEEEYYTEIIEELIIPFGPNGYDFAAARKKTDVELATEPSKDIVKSSINTFSTESDFIGKKSSIFTSVYQPIPKREWPSVFTTPSKKEQFLLTTDDLSKVSLLPPRPKTEKPSMEFQPFRKSYSSVEDQSSVHKISKFTVMPNSDHSIARSTTTGKYSYEDIHPSIVQNGITSKSKTQPISVSKDKPTILPKPSYMVSSIPTDNVPVFSEDESLYSNDPLLTKSRPHLLMNSHSNPLRRSAVDHPRGADYSRKEVYTQRSVHAGAGSDAVADGGEQTNSVPPGYNADTQEQQDVLQRQYLALKSQIQQWQDQLAWNQSLLASQAVGSEHQAERYQQLSDQMAMQQEMAMQQLQSTLMALQQQQQQHMPASGQDNGEPSAELAARVHQPVAGAAEPTYMASASPPSIVASPQKQLSDVRSGVNTVKKRPKIERQLEPREQLMIAIRTFSKRDLKSVPIEMTRWTPSALS